MNDDLSSISEEERCLFRPFTRESLVVIQGRIAEEQRKIKELERRRAEGEVVHRSIIYIFLQPDFLLDFRSFDFLFSIFKMIVVYGLYICVCRLNVLSLSSLYPPSNNIKTNKMKNTKKPNHKIYVSVSISV